MNPAGIEKTPNGLIIFKFITFFFGLICMIVHIVGFSYKQEPLAHEMVFCGTYMAFTSMSLLIIIGRCRLYITSLSLEVFISLMGFLLYVFTAFLSMYFVEFDSHMMYLTDFEEWHHYYFRINRLQSIFSLTTSLVYLMNAVFAVDMLLIKDPSTADRSPSDQRRKTLMDLDMEAKQPLRINQFWVPAINRCKQRSTCSKCTKCTKGSKCSKCCRGEDSD